MKPISAEAAVFSASSVYFPGSEVTLGSLIRTFAAPIKEIAMAEIPMTAAARAARAVIFFAAAGRRKGPEEKTGRTIKAAPPIRIAIISNRRDPRHRLQSGHLVFPGAVICRPVGAYGISIYKYKDHENYSARFTLCRFAPFFLHCWRRRGLCLTRNWRGLKGR